MKRLFLLLILGITGAAASGCVYHDRPYYGHRDRVYYEPVPARWHHDGYWHHDGDWRWHRAHGYY